MKKILIASIVSLSLLSNSSFAEMHDPSNTSGGSSVILLISPVLSSIGISYMLKDLSATKTDIQVNKIEERNNGRTYIQGTANGKPIEFETATPVVKEAKLKQGNKIQVKDAKLGYVMEANNVALGIVSTPANPNDFKQKKLN